MSHVSQWQCLCCFPNDPDLTLQREWWSKYKPAHGTVQGLPLFSPHWCVIWSLPTSNARHSPFLCSDRIPSVLTVFLFPEGGEPIGGQNINRNLFLTLGPYASYSFSLSPLPKEPYMVAFFSFRMDLTCHPLNRIFLDHSGTLITTHNTLLLSRGF